MPMTGHVNQAAIYFEHGYISMKNLPLFRIAESDLSNTIYLSDLGEG